MVRSTRTTALLLALALVVALSGCTGALDDGAATETPTTATDGTTDSPTGTAAATDGSTTGTDEPTAGAPPSDSDAATEGAAPTATEAPTTLPPAEATAAFVEDGETLATVELEIADSPSERRRGLMNRTSLPADRGMVFVYGDAAPRSFWMKNTLIPLDIVFVAPNGTVLNVEHARTQPNASDSELDSYRSEGPARYVVEVNRGFANRTGVEAGTTVEFSGLDGSDG